MQDNSLGRTPEYFDETPTLTTIVNTWIEDDEDWEPSLCSLCLGKGTEEIGGMAPCQQCDGTGFVRG